MPVSEQAIRAALPRLPDWLAGECVTWVRQLEARYDNGEAFTSGAAAAKHWLAETNMTSTVTAICRVCHSITGEPVLVALPDDSWRMMCPTCAKALTG